MPDINQAHSKAKSRFKPKKYRAWNLDEEDNDKIQAPSPNNAVDSIIDLPTNQIINWEYHDRPENELGDIEALAKDFKEIGQQQPCIVRPHPIKNGKYELIIGERRWRAAKTAGVNLKVIIRDYSDAESALAQATENEQRKNLSEYAKGIYFSRLIDNGILKQKDLIEKLGKSKQYISAMLSFSKIPIEIVNAIGDMSLVSSRTAEKIKQLCSKDIENINKIIKYADKIRAGKLGLEKLESLIKDKEAQQYMESGKGAKVYGESGRHLFTWRLDNNKTPSIHFPKDILKRIKQSGHISEKFTNGIITLITKEIEHD